MRPLLDIPFLDVHKGYFFESSSSRAMMTDALRNDTDFLLSNPATAESILSSLRNIEQGVNLVEITTESWEEKDSFPIVGVISIANHTTNNFNQ
ncbi:MAG: hypothetical protein H9535_03760 [Ignavibacteria bacterium]|nr:hypothetical protein [Ignavibacteria bacterium]